MKRRQLILALGLMFIGGHAAAEPGWVGQFSVTTPGKTVQAGQPFSGTLSIGGPCDVALTFTRGVETKVYRLDNLSGQPYSGQFPTKGLLGGDLVPGVHTVVATSTNPAKCVSWGNTGDTLTVTAPPVVSQVNSDMLVIASQESAVPMKNAKQPFPTGKFQYSLTQLKPPGCKVDVRILGPENVFQNGVTLLPGEMSASGEWSGVKSGSFELRKPGKYTLTLVTSANAPAELRCAGMPIGRAFDVVQAPSRFQSTTPGMYQPINPITPGNPLILPDAGKARP